MAILFSAALSTHAADRIVSTAGNTSEIIVKLGKADHLIGVDTTSLIPADVMQSKAKIGYRRQLSAEGILSLNPDLIILAPEAGPPAVIDQIRAANIPTLTFKDKQTLAGIREDITTLGNAIDASTQAATLNQQIEQDEAALSDSLKKSGHGSALILINTGSQGSYALGNNSAGQHLLDILQLENAFHVDGSKPIASEILATSPADVILIANRGDAATSPIITATDLSQNPQLARTPAGAKHCVYSVNILAALGFGWNTAANAKQILDTIQPCLQK